MNLELHAEPGPPEPGKWDWLWSILITLGFFGGGFLVWSIFS